MPTKPPSARPRAAAAARKRTSQTVDHRRGSAQSRGYDAAWRAAAKSHLRTSPLCRYCELGAFGQAPRVTAASLVDHLYPHRGDRVLFWARRLWVSACRPCHDGPKQAAERIGGAALDRLAALLGIAPPLV